MRIQVCFQVKDEEHNNQVIEKLKELKGKIAPEDTIISCHLPKCIVEEKGWSTMMVDALNSIFENQYISLVNAENFDEAMSKMNDYRKEASQIADKIYVIGEQSIANIALEIEMFTNKNIQFL